MKLLMSQKILLFIGIIVISVSCNNNEPSQEVTAFIDDNSIPLTNVSEAGENGPKLEVVQVQIIDSVLFEKSLFKNIGCSRDFWFERKGPECCCEEVLSNYQATIKGLEKGAIAVINVKDPIIKKCRKKAKGWSRKFDDLTNPRPAVVPPPKDDGGI